MNLIKRSLLPVCVSLTVLSGCATMGPPRESSKPKSSTLIDLGSGLSVEFGALKYLKPVSKMYSEGYPIIKLVEGGFKFYFPLEKLSPKECLDEAAESANKNGDNKTTIEEAKELRKTMLERFTE
jgi:hypothetical protein